MNLQADGTRRVLLWVGRVLVLGILSVCARGLTAPKLSFNRAVESKRPKFLKNIDRVTSTVDPDADKPTKDPWLPRTEFATQAQEAVRGARPGGLPWPGRAFTELTKPDYLRLRWGLPAHRPSTPPA